LLVRLAYDILSCSELFFSLAVTNAYFPVGAIVAAGIC